MFDPVHSNADRRTGATHDRPRPSCPRGRRAGRPARARANLPAPEPRRAPADAGHPRQGLVRAIFDPGRWGSTPRSAWTRASHSSSTLAPAIQRSGWRPGRIFAERRSAAAWPRVHLASCQPIGGALLSAPSRRCASRAAARRCARTRRRRRPRGRARRARRAAEAISRTLRLVERVDQGDEALGLVVARPREHAGCRRGSAPRPPRRSPDSRPARAAGRRAPRSDARATPLRHAPAASPSRPLHVSVSGCARAARQPRPRRRRAPRSPPARAGCGRPARPASRSSRWSVALSSSCTSSRSLISAMNGRKSWRFSPSL